MSVWGRRGTTHRARGARLPAGLGTPYYFRGSRRRARPSLAGAGGLCSARPTCASRDMCLAPAPRTPRAARRRRRFSRALCRPPQQHAPTRGRLTSSGAPARWPARLAALGALISRAGCRDKLRSQPGDDALANPSGVREVAGGVAGGAGPRRGPLLWFGLERLRRWGSRPAHAAAGP